MKKKIYYVVSCIVVVIALIVSLSFNNNEYILKNNNIKVNKPNSTLSIMLERRAGLGIYELSSDNSWPTNGYIFNEDLSSCENGGFLTFNENTNKVTVKNNKSDKCYIYFDAKIPQIIDACTSGITLSNCILDLRNKGGENLYGHAVNLIGAMDSSTRFIGANPNNWVCFGMDDTTKTYAEGWCDDDHLYRIIGIFGSEYYKSAKLIKAYEIGEDLLGLSSTGSVYKIPTYYKGNLTTSPGYYWTGSNGVTSNTWKDSKLKAALNNAYLTSLGTTWSNKIVTESWHVGGNTTSKILDVPVAIKGLTVYKNEYTDGNGTTVSAKIGLMYASDYGLAAPPEIWSSKLSEYGTSNNRDNNWLFLGPTEWTITKVKDDNYYVYAIDTSGNVTNRSGYNNNSIVRPSFYLSNTIKYVGGNGTKDDPIRVN